MNNNFLKNFVFAFGSQVVSLLATLVVTFISPKLIGVEDFAYWQLFLTYVTYVNITRFGLNDGLYLRLGGKEYRELNYSLLSQERRVFILFEILVAFIISIVISKLNISADRKFILQSCCICIILINANGYLIYILQAVNLTRIYSLSVMIQNSTWFIAVAIIYFAKIYSYKVIIVMYIFGHLLAGIYIGYKAKEIVCYKKENLFIVLADIKSNISCGIKLMIASYVGSFIIASVRIIVDIAWGVKIFGYFSFSLTLANVFLNFINQVSIVVFPALRRIKPDKQKEVYFFMRNVLRFILPIVMLGYLPIVIFVEIFLNNYTTSLKFLPIFLPICTFEGKMQMMCSSFFKSMRKENTLLRINVITLVISILIALLGAFYIKNIYFVAFGILFVVALRSVLSEIILAKYMQENIKGEIFQELLLVFLFIVGAINLNPLEMFISFSIIYLLYLAINIKSLKGIVCLKKII